MVLFAGVALLAKSLYQPSMTQVVMTPERHQMSKMFGLNTAENLKAYHYGLKTIYPIHSIPAKENLLESIRAYPMFIGEVTKPLAAAEVSSRLETTPFFIYEIKKQEDAPHFYLASSKGVRHFTVELRGVLASIDNGVMLAYPMLSHFIECSLG